MRLWITVCLCCAYTLLPDYAHAAASLPGTAPLNVSGDLSAQMVSGIDAWLTRETDRIATMRDKQWHTKTAAELPDLRERFRRMIGAVDAVVANPEFEIVHGLTDACDIYQTRGQHPFRVQRVRWQVVENVWAEGLLLQPLDSNGGSSRATTVAIVLPDADQTPEALVGLVAGVKPESQMARHLAESGWRVLVPALVSRDDTFSGNERLKRFTNQPHREWMYRQSYELGRHVLGYEVETVSAAVSALHASNKVALAGYGEGGIVALHAAALDARIGAVLVSGSFGPREQLWREPIYRNVFGLLRDFGDAELACLSSGALIVEHADPPPVQGPPAARAGRSGAAPGVVTNLEFGAVETEVERANALLKQFKRPPATFVYGSEGMAVQFGSHKALTALALAVGVTNEISFELKQTPLNAPVTPDPGVTAPSVFSNRQHRIVRAWEKHTQSLLTSSESDRDAAFWSKLSNTNEFTAGLAQQRDFFWKSVIGKIDQARVTPNPRARLVTENAKWVEYEVVLDVLPDVFAWGLLLVPTDLKPGERRPVVVCQHGLEGLPEDTVTTDPQSSGYKYYQAFAARLAESGFITFAPHNPYRGRDAFRVLQRKANPLGLSLFSFIIAQHEVATDWLASLPFVDASRIAFYGLSYGGKTAMRVPAVIPRYCLSICSGDFNDWVRKNAITESSYSYLYTGEYEMPEWDLGHTFNYAEMAALIFPRPFMVERGHNDTVAPDTWVAYEFAKVRRLYDAMNLSPRAEIEFFNGPHQIHGVGTFEFLKKHLQHGVTAEAR